MTKTLELAEVKRFLKQLEGLHISAVQKLADESGLHFGLGPVFVTEELSHLKTRSKKIPTYSVCVYGEIVLSHLDSSCEMLSARMSREQLQSLRSFLLQQTVQRAEVDAQLQLRLVLDQCIIESRCIVTEDMWELYQPRTEEDSVFVTASTATLHTKTYRRWSREFPQNRNRWHSFNEFFAKEETSGNMVSIQKAEAMLQSLLGKTVSYGLKSSDMDLLDLGIEDHALHITCSVCVAMPDGTMQMLYGDSPQDKYNALSQCLIGKRVLEARIEEANTLVFQFEGCTVKIIPAEDTMESWRLLKPNSNDPHLIAQETALYAEEAAPQTET